ncbi:NAD-dependent epimerase/dehydratase family protein [Methylobacterium iners]|uniref:dTDP-4-dehydro-6-deoxyglucose reductase n=1 Tax=Methylobacterium iners TaxID=418707 RepID=A0ABQ4S0K3_9HYPH|nr:NAD-dependent epimerase/dehydratase family protein [Methylobacterium iners]GJD96650.1 dTDP-4-dehydro-6-deoxyglucose reductase [Methylobacterium iners]
MTSRHLILGGCGFIGRHVANRLALNGDTVTLVDRNAPAFILPSEASTRVNWRQAELDAPNWDDLVAQADVVHHYAWDSIPASANKDPGGDLSRNVRPTINLLDALVRRGSGTLIFASSGGTVYGNILQLPISEDHAIRPVTAYGTGKATAELYLQLYRQMHGVDCRIARIANPYGAGQNVARGLGAVTTFIDKALKNEPISIFGDGEVVRDYIHISDVAICLAEIAKAPISDEYIFNVGSGLGTSLNQLVEHLEAGIGRRITVQRLVGRSFDVSANVLSVERIKRVYGWSPRLTLREGMRLTLSNLAEGREFPDSY